MQADKASCDNPWNTALCRDEEIRPKKNQKNVLAKLKQDLRVVACDGFAYQNIKF